MNLADKVAIITGSSNGIGAATAIKFASAGCKLTITGRNRETLEQTLSNCINVGLKENLIVVVEGDITDDKTRHDLITKTIEQFGKLDILVNNAGTAAGGFDISDYDLCMNVNVRSVILLTQLCLPYIQKSKGTIINISSLASTRHPPTLMYYAMSKAALDSYTKSLAQKLGNSGVRVNSINPGFIRTNIHARCGIKKEHLEKFYQAGAQSALLGRIGESKEIADCVLFLASEKSKYITGQCIIIDGGTSLKKNFIWNKEELS